MDFPWPMKLKQGYNCTRVMSKMVCTKLQHKCLIHWSLVYTQPARATPIMPFVHSVQSTKQIWVPQFQEILQSVPDHCTVVTAIWGKTSKNIWNGHYSYREVLHSIRQAPPKMCNIFIERKLFQRRVVPKKRPLLFLERSEIVWERSPKNVLHSYREKHIPKDREVHNKKIIIIYSRVVNHFTTGVLKTKIISKKKQKKPNERGRYKLKQGRYSHCRGKLKCTLESVYTFKAEIQQEQGAQAQCFLLWKEVYTGIYTMLKCTTSVHPEPIHSRNLFSSTLR